MLEHNRILDFLRGKQEIKNAYRAVFDNPNGQAVLKHLSENCYVFSPTYVPNDPNETAHREGMRRVVLSIIRELNSPDDILTKMIEENFHVSQAQTPERSYG